jgi:hypothetical protein
MMIIMRTLANNVKSQLPAFGSALTDARGLATIGLYQGELAARAALVAGRRRAEGLPPPQAR